MKRYGVVVGRFQVAELHPGHLALLRHAAQINDRMIIFVAVARTGPTNRNPLDFETRHRMLFTEFPDAVIIPIRDERSDEVWSGILDAKIAELTDRSAAVTLYGGPDSFIRVYKGVHNTVIRPRYSPYQSLDITLSSGSAQRNRVAGTVRNTFDWRYQNDPDAKITTCFHIGWASSYAAKAGDDLERVVWFPTEKMPKLTEEHSMLCLALKKLINKRFYHDSDDPNPDSCKGDPDGFTI